LTVVPYLLWIWHYRDLIKSRLQGTSYRPVNLKDIVLMILILPPALTGGIGALWLYYKGWEDFTRTITICIEFGFIGGGILATYMIIINQIKLYLTKKRKPKPQE